MQYFGGKHRIADSLVPAMRGATHYVEPFVGGASVLCRMAAPSRSASDANLALITMWKELQRGWEPPANVTEDDYAAAKSLPDTDPLKAFIGFGASFSGKWFGGYARGATGRNYASGARNGLLKKIKMLSGVEFRHCDYKDADYRPGCTVYSDPPYKGTTQYGAVGTFDWDDFWKFMSALAEKGCSVFVSEYSAPDGWRPVVVKETKTDIRTNANGKETRTEKLFVRAASEWDKMWRQPFVRQDLL